MRAADVASTAQSMSLGRWLLIPYFKTQRFLSPSQSSCCGRKLYSTPGPRKFKEHTGLNVLATNRRNCQVNFMIQASKSQKREFRHFSGAKVCYSNGNVRFQNFMHMEWSEEKFLKGIVGDKRRLRF